MCEVLLDVRNGLTLANDLPASGTRFDPLASIGVLAIARVVAAGPTARRAHPTKVRRSRVVGLTVRLAALRLILSRIIHSLVDVVYISIVVHIFLYKALARQSDFRGL